MTLGPIDLIVLLSSVAIAIAIGVRNGSKTDSVESFLFGNRSLPWWAILGSIVATETSTATVLSLPGLAYGPSGMKFLQLALGYIAGRLVVIYLLLPLFFDGKLSSAYEVLGRRFGHRTKHAASALFMVTRNLGDGLRLFLAAIVLQKLLNWNLASCTIAIGAITIVYTYFGGMRSIVWNDCIQFAIYMLGGVATLFVIAGNIPGGWSRIYEFANENHKFRWIDLVFDQASISDSSSWLDLLTNPFTFWAGLVGGAVLTVGTHGTDQMMIQRYLSARSQRDAGWAIFCSSLVVFIQFSLFLFIGVQLACYYASFPEINFTRNDEVYAHFLVHSFPKNTGLIGLMLAAILAAAMSTLSSSLNASASAVINDFYLPTQTTVPESSKVLRLSRRLTFAFGVLQILIGILAVRLSENVVNNALTLAGFTAGLLLGLFLLAACTKQLSENAALLGAFVGLLVLLTTHFLLPIFVPSPFPDGKPFSIAWPWYAMIGSTTTVLTGLIASFGMNPQAAQAPRKASSINSPEPSRHESAT